MRIQILLLLAVLLCGCDNSDNRRPIAPNYEVEFIGGDSLLHTPGNVRLYYVPKSEKSVRIWSYITGRTPIAVENLIVFNGGLSDDKRWKVYPALLACQGPGPAVEISRALSRKVKEGAEYSFLLVSFTNGNLRLTGRQHSPVDTGKPLNIDLELSKDEILSAIGKTLKRGEKRKYEKIDYFIEP